MRQDVWLPEGVWYGVFDGKRYEGGLTHSASNDINSFPLFVKAGCPLTARPFSKSVREPLTDVVIEVFADGSVDFGCAELYEDDGISEPDAENCRITKISYRKSGRRHTLTLEPITGERFPGPSARCVGFRLHGVGICESVSGEVIYDVKSKTASVKLADVPASEKLKIELTEV